MGHPETNHALLAGRELHIEKWVYGGAGLARTEGRAVLMPFVLPGETVRAAVRRERSGLLEARVEDIVGPAPERCPPLCPYFTRCGGCHYQHAGYEFQLEQKKAVLREVFRRVGKLEAPAEIETIASPPWEYRNRAQFHLVAGRIGYLEAGSHRLCPVERCPISSPKINEALSVLREMVGDRRFPRFVRSVELFTNEREVQLTVREADRPVARRFFDWCAERIPGAAEGSLDYAAAGYVYRVSHNSFFQVNRFLTDKLVECALGDAAGSAAVDLYAGVGLFSLPLAGRFRQATAVETGSAAIRDLEWNAERASVCVKAVKSQADLFLLSLDAAPDFLLADPPRPGLTKSVVRQLVRLRPPRMAIVSCDPATLARDLGPLLSAGYRIEKLVLIDLFPQTYHIETVTHLRRSE
jgi:23S rRNA (uracil1939-C5)-methyltransferase